MLLEFNPCLSKYSAFNGLTPPPLCCRYHEIMTFLLDNGADTNSRNYCCAFAVTFDYYCAINLIGTGARSTPLNFAACGQSLKCFPGAEFCSKKQYPATAQTEFQPIINQRLSWRKLRQLPKQH